MVKNLNYIQDKYLVTVICICYNHEQYVQDCIESIIKQTYQNIEFIIVDNNSQDNSVIIIEKFSNELSKRFINYKFMKNESNIGITKALNKAIRLSQGDFISFISADDVFVYDKTETQIIAFKSLDENYGVICGNIDFINSNNQKIYLDSNGEIISKKNCYYEFGNEYLLRNRNSKEIMSHYGEYKTLFINNYIQAATVLIRRKVLEEVGLFDESFFYEDWPLWLNISKNYKFYYIDKVFFNYRKHPTVMTNTFHDKFNVENTRIILREKKYCFQHNYKNLWKKKYSDRLFSFIFNKDIRIFLIFLFKAKSFNLILYLIKKIIFRVLHPKKQNT